MGKIMLKLCFFHLQVCVYIFIHVLVCMYMCNLGIYDGSTSDQ